VPKQIRQQLPRTGGVGVASLAVLGSGVLLIGGGLLVRRFSR
jgi:LPXTG-motif cell wall-anchored protein